jgi:hypothetical protein
MQPEAHGQEQTTTELQIDEKEEILVVRESFKSL